MQSLVEARTIPQEVNPFSVIKGGKELAHTNRADTEAQRAIAEVQAAMVMAKRFPRDQIAAMDRILNACTRPTLAEGALYAYNRGGSEVSGPSIRLAEAIAQTWGNISFGISELEQRDGVSVVQAFAWDLETNTRQVKDFHVPHVRSAKGKMVPLTDPRDIYEMVANQGARRLRACILSVIPGDVVEAAKNQCEVTLKTSADTSNEAVKKMLEAFGEFGVSKEQIEKRIQSRADAIRPAQMVQMKKIYASLRDGMSSPADWFEPVDLPAAGGAKGSKKADQKPEPEPEPAPEPQAEPEAKPEPEPEAGRGAHTDGDDGPVRLFGDD